MLGRHIDQLKIGLSTLDWRTFVKTLLQTCYSHNHYYILNLNLSNMERPPRSRLECTFTKLEAEDIDQIRATMHLLDPDSRRHLATRLHFYYQGFRSCYALRTRTNHQIACIQWIIRPDENALLHRSFPRRYLPLRSSEVMLENIFVFPRFRGLGLVRPISYELLHKAKHEGFRTAVGYIRKDSILSLNEFMRMGFTIKKLGREFKLLGYTKRIF